MTASMETKEVINPYRMERAISPSSFQTISIDTIPRLDFDLPAELEAGEPAEERGLRRDQVRLMVSTLYDNQIRHTRFDRLPDFLRPGDVLVLNTSATLKAAINVTRQDGQPLELHLSTHLPGDLWVIELRQPSPKGTLPFYTAVPGEELNLPQGAKARLLTPYRPDQRRQAQKTEVRLWIAELETPICVTDFFERWGFPIRYKYVRETWPINYYQTVYATQPGSAEMPSAGRAFTTELITRLVARGVRIAPLILHTGVASLEDHEPPYEEYYRVPLESAQTINAARANGNHIIAVGTTSVRALETVAGEDGIVYPGEGWTDLVITPHRGVHAVDGLLTGLHEPRSTHLSMLEALAGRPHLCKTYVEALEKGYLWHEFGDLHLILP